jgi:putative two-component system response regulator
VLTDDDRILVVDDDPQICTAFVRILEDAGYRAASAASAEAARALLRGREIALVIVDVNLPGESGIELVRQIGLADPNVAAMMVSGLDDPGLAQTALEYGAYGYLTKPVRRNDLVIAVINALRRRELEIARRAEHAQLSRTVIERTSDLERTIDRLDVASLQLARSREETIRQLAHAVELRHFETGDHVERMSRYCGLLASRVGLDSESMRIASQMHDIGKIGVPDTILLKPGPLAAEERQQMERHALFGYDLLRKSSSETLKLASVIALTHHERFDGTGYPNGLVGEEIPLEGRIAAVADVFDALTTDRVYRTAMSIPVAIATMRAEGDRHFDPYLLDAFFDGLDDVEVIHEQFVPRSASSSRPTIA